MSEIVPVAGSPPHMRGKDAEESELLQCHRITPAHAGKRAVKIVNGFVIMDHPRTCGEKKVGDFANESM